jgi:hypothetical protein
LSKLWTSRFGFGACTDGIMESIEKEKRKRRTTHEYKKWEVGF